MLNKLDDFPIHQTPEPIAHLATSDRNAYDRTWYNGYAEDGAYYFGIGMAIYPHRGVQDCAFSVVQQGGRQHCFYGSRRAPLERTDMAVGPFRIEVVEPMRRTRVILDDNSTGLSCDLTFSARTGPIQEARQTLSAGTRRTMDATRFDQFGRWEGVIRSPDGDIRVSEDVCRATKDRSWGVRRVGEAETDGAPSARPAVFFLWAPLMWDDHVTHAIFFDGTQGEPIVREGIVAPLFSSTKLIPDAANASDKRMATARHRVAYVPQTRLARSAEIDLVAYDGTTRTISLEPLLKFQMKGLGYGHPEWGHGVWKGELAIGGETFDPTTLNMLEPPNVHVQQVVRAQDGSNTGMGVLEQLCIGPYAPSGFVGQLDGAKPD